MHIPEVFELDLQPGDGALPARIRIALQRCTVDERGRAFITPECISLDEIEGQIKRLQDELDQLRERARRAYQVQ